MSRKRIVIATSIVVLVGSLVGGAVAALSAPPEVVTDNAPRFVVAQSPYKRASGASIADQREVEAAGSAAQEKNTRNGESTESNLGSGSTGTGSATEGSAAHGRETPRPDTTHLTGDFAATLLKHCPNVAKGSQLYAFRFLKPDAGTIKAMAPGTLVTGLPESVVRQEYLLSTSAGDQATLSASMGRTFQAARASEGLETLPDQLPVIESIVAAMAGREIRSLILEQREHIKAPTDNRRMHLKPAQPLWEVLSTGDGGLQTRYFDARSGKEFHFDPTANLR